MQKGSNGKLYVNGSFSVKEIGYDEDRNINKLWIVDGKGNNKYVLKAPQSPQREENTKAKPQVVEPPKEPIQATEGTLKCSSCGIGITEKVESYSKEKYGKALCYKCQKGA